MFYDTFMGIIHKHFFLFLSKKSQPLQGDHLFSTTIVNVIIFPCCNMPCFWGTESSQKGFLKHFTCCDDECFASINVIRAI